MTTNKNTIDWDIMAPYLNPPQLRILTAMSDGDKYKCIDLIEPVGRGKCMVTIHLRKLVSLGLVKQVTAGPRSYAQLAKPWPDTIEEIMKRIQVSHDMRMAAIADLRDKPPELGEALPPNTPMTAFKNNRRLNGP